MQELLVLDDVGSALRLMTDVGRTVVAKPAFEIRDAVYELARKRGWQVVQHEAFATWAKQTLARDERDWLVLDPLLAPAALVERARSLRLTREFEGKNTTVTSGIAGGEACLAQLRGLTGAVGILDDVVSSGRTIRLVSQALASAGMTAGPIVVCAGSRVGRDQLRRWCGASRWSEYLPGDWLAVHLRDCCPFLPYTGRAAPVPVLTAFRNLTVEPRISITGVQGHPWQALLMNRNVLQAVKAAHQSAVARLNVELGRPATVRDLKLLGAAVPIIVEAACEISDSTALSSLVT